MSKKKKEKKKKKKLNIMISEILRKRLLEQTQREKYQKKNLQGNTFIELLQDLHRMAISRNN